MFQRLLICTDFSDSVDRLVQFVPSLEAAGLKQITFLHCVPLWDSGSVPRVDTEKVSQARERLQPALKEIPAEMVVRVEVESGRPMDAILRTAHDHQADLIVLGMPTRNLLTEKLFGSTTIDLCQRTSVPLMIIRPQLLSTYTTEELDLRCRHLFRYWLIPYDGRETAQYLIQCIKQVAQQNPQKSLEQCHLCWVVDDGGRREVPKDYQVQAAQETLAAVSQELASLNLRVDPVEVRQGNPVLEVLEAAQMSDVSAIVTSSSSLGKFLEWSVPSFASELLRRSWHPIIFFPCLK